MGKEVAFDLPWPPSLNRYYRNVGYRVLISREGRQYRMMTVSRLAGMVEKLKGNLKVFIELYPPDNRRRDVDNSLKCCLDALTHAGVYEDDSQIKDLRVVMREAIPPDGMIHVTIKEKEPMNLNEETEYVPSWVKHLEKQREIVREFLESLDDGTLIKTAYLYTQGYSDEKVMKELGFDETALKQIKERLAVGLKLAGIEVRK